MHAKYEVSLFYSTNVMSQVTYSSQREREMVTDTVKDGQRNMQAKTEGTQIIFRGINKSEISTWKRI